MKKEKYNIPKNIWMYWEQGFDNAPFVVQKCLESWQRENPTWTIILLDKNNIDEYILLDVPNEYLSKLMLANKSDLIRLKLLELYGGVWADATTYCMKPLDDWLVNVTNTGFFVFSRPGEDRLLSSWFIVSEKNSLIITEWYRLLAAYWKNNKYVAPDNFRTGITHRLERIFNRNTRSTKYWFSPIVTRILKIYPYFVVHYIFERVVSTDQTAKKIWEKTPKISADSPHMLQHIGLQTEITEKIKKLIYNTDIPIYKLTYRNFDLKAYPKSLLYYLFEGRFLNEK